MLVNVVDTPELCSFGLPPVYRRDPIAIAVSTGGASPALAKRLRDELGARIGGSTSPADDCATSALGEAPPSYGARRVLRIARRGVAVVTVFLVGAGPGDPGLITARGLELIRGCDVLVHDRLVAEELVAEAPDDAISIGRERLEQDEINRMLVLYGLRGLNVVRLKGGDPFVFGRGGEEALVLAEAGVRSRSSPVLVDRPCRPPGHPGDTPGSLLQVTIVNGQGSLDFAGSHVRRHLVVFMGLARLAEIADGLLSRPRAGHAGCGDLGATRAGGGGLDARDDRRGGRRPRSRRSSSATSSRCRHGSRPIVDTRCRMKVVCLPGDGIGGR
jgi:uroporphyrin-III C-methyltransferase/precorrin-2 dehydrogenase/sirohydrochlorin ferrochelatase